MTRLLALGALALAAVAVALVLTSGSDYVVHARFVDAGQLVKGGLVEVGGRSVGKVRGISLTPDGQADVELALSDHGLTPLHRGTIARIRTVGLSGIANRFVELEPGPAAGAVIPDGGVMTTAETRPVVDLDVVLDALDPPTRRHLQRILKAGSQTFAGSGAADANVALGYLDPALSQSDLLVEELARDRVALRRLIATGAQATAALASRPDDVAEGVRTTATTLRALAAERAALADSLGRAPGVLAQAGGTLRAARGVLAQAQPALRELQPVTPRLTAVLERLVPVSRAARPVLAQTRAVLPALTRALTGAPALERAATPALRSTTTTVTQLLPIVEQLRPYADDVIAGLFNGFGGLAAGYYDANGEFGRISIQTGPAGGEGTLGTGPSTGGYRTGDVARCPGGASEPAPDRSNPWVPDPSTCDPRDDH